MPPHVDVQRMALDPFAAIVQPAQGAHCWIDLHTEQPLEGVQGAHLIRHRADAADARRDVRGFAGVAAAQQRLEEARRLEDLEAQVDQLAALDGEVQCSLTLDAGEHADVDRLSLCLARGHRWYPATVARSR